MCFEPKRAKKVLANPSAFFKGLKTEKGMERAFVYLAVISIFTVALRTVVGQIFDQQIYGWIGSLLGVNIPKIQLSLIELVTVGLLSYASGLAISFIWAGILHVWCLIFSGKGNYSKSYQLAVYSSTPNLVFGWIPFVNLVVWIYSVYLLIVGTRELHKIEKTKATLIYLIPTLILVAIALLFAFVFFSYLKLNPGILQNITNTSTLV